MANPDDECVLERTKRVVNTSSSILSKTESSIKQKFSYVDWATTDCFNTTPLLALGHYICYRNQNSFVTFYLIYVILITRFFYSTL